MPTNEPLSEAEIAELRDILGNQPWGAFERDAIVHCVARLLATVEAQAAAMTQHDLCHDLHGKVNAEDFAKGCEAEVRRIYGSCPWDALRAENELLRAQLKSARRMFP